MFRLSSTVGSTRIQVGKFEDYMVYWRPSDYTVWVTNQNSGLINYDNTKAYDASEVMLTAIAMLKSQQGIQQLRTHAGHFNVRSKTKKCGLLLEQ